MKQRSGLDRNVLRPIPGDPWRVEHHHWNTGANENQQLNPGGPSNRQESSGPKPTKINSFMSGPSSSLTFFMYVYMKNGCLASDILQYAGTNMYVCI